MKTKVVQHVSRIKFDNLTTGQLDDWTTRQLDNFTGSQCLSDFQTFLFVASLLLVFGTSCGAKLEKWLNINKKWNSYLMVQEEALILVQVHLLSNRYRTAFTSMRIVMQQSKEHSSVSTSFSVVSVLLCIYDPKCFTPQVFCFSSCQSLELLFS